jgi:transcriptional regulator with XRE-family HTH domain
MKRSFRLIDHDPEIDKFKTLWRDEHLKESDFAMLAGLSVQTVHKLFNNETKRPQGLTYRKMATAMGYTYTLTRELTPNYETEIPKARDEYREHQAELKKRRERANKRNNGK